MSTISALLEVGLLGLGGLSLVAIAVALRRRNRRRRADQRPDPMILNTERAQALRSLAAADYAKFTARRNGHPR